jgi:hypothetical protein
MGGGGYLSDTRKILETIDMIYKVCSMKMLLT